MQVTQVELPLDISPEKIFEINVKITTDEDFRNKVVSNPTILSDYIGVPKEVLKNIKLPPTISTEFKQVLISASTKIIEHGIAKAEEFEYMMSKAQNYIDLVLVLPFIVAIVVWLWLWVF